MNMKQYRRDRRMKVARKYAQVVVDASIIAFVVLASLALSYGVMLVMPD